MMRLDDPTSGYDDTLTTCISGVLRKAFKDKIELDKPVLIQAGKDYITAGKAGTLTDIHPTDPADADPVVIGSLRKSELVNLYEYYFRNKEKVEARKIYSKLLSCAGEECPFCGGIGKPRNLDHFLPKSRFPQFSVLPQNLVPSCRDCNMEGKAEEFAKTASDLIIHPYVDDDKFFKQQWIQAKCILDNNNLPSSVFYFVSPPNGWNQVDKDRVKKHFDSFGLANNYALQASVHLQTHVDTITALRKANIPNELIRTAIIDPGMNNAPFINHWVHGMFQALSGYLG
ncbi:HNH endonuclease [Duganella sp. CY15W]|uniref:HNH endonuclease n=1 Tax=Duganella sp. CY15W TaxID=2692172 RepID=UPI00136D2749|nr:HNH endonuclease [Duganella sp. CY15W]MYM29299.1 HNH endonuclease [Duganella sp. CY15W]